MNDKTINRICKSNSSLPKIPTMKEISEMIRISYNEYYEISKNYKLKTSWKFKSPCKDFTEIEFLEFENLNLYITTKGIFVCGNYSKPLLEEED